MVVSYCLENGCLSVPSSSRFKWAYSGMLPKTMSVNAPSQDSAPDLYERLADIPRERLIEEVVARWDEIVGLEGDIAVLRRKLGEAEGVAQLDRADGSKELELEERLRLADASVRQLERQLENERVRREIAETETARFSELQDENSRLLKNEEELLLLILDMEAQIDRLSVSKDEG